MCGPAWDFGPGPGFFVDALSTGNFLMADPTYFYLPKYFAAERELSAYVKRMKKASCQQITPITTGLEGLQCAAVEQACSSPISLLYGKPGTGKTTTMRRIVQSFDMAGMTGIIMAPAAKAAKRAAEVLDTGYFGWSSKPECVTTYRGLEYNGGIGTFMRNYKRPLDVDYVILEETGMLGCLNACDVLSAIDPKKTRIILSGDPYQLPSVEAGNVFYDLITSDFVPKVELEKIHRTGPKSGIAINAARMLQGILPLKNHPDTGEPFDDCFFVPRESEEDTLKTILEYITEKIPAKRGVDRLSGIQSLAPGKKSTCGTDSLNKELRAILNPSGRLGVRQFRCGDKVINRRNNYSLGIVNGDVGLIKDISASGMTVDFGLGAGLDGCGIVEIQGDSLDAIHLAYSYTVHSSQGSEYPVVLMPIHRCHWKLLFQNLLYTGWTRAKQLTIFLGDIDAFRYGIQNRVTEKRKTGLKSLLR